MKITWYIPFIAALVPLLVGMIWYNPKVFGTAWMRVTGMTPEKGREANMSKMFDVTYPLSLLMCVIIATASIHQFHIFADDPGFRTGGSETQQKIAAFMELYGSNFRAFKHGLFHGTVLGVVCAVPVIGINALFEMKSFKYIAINAGYWIVSVALVGGVISVWL